MSWLNRRFWIAALAVAGSGALVPAAATAGTVSLATSWTKISTNTGLGIASGGLFRTGDGRLHVVWPRNDGTTSSLHYSTVGANAKLLATGTVLQKWEAVSAYPRLVAGPSGGIRLVFTGANGQSGSPYNVGTMYSATSTSAGTTWALTPGSMSQSTFIPLTDDAAVTESDGTPVAGWARADGVGYHVGIDPHTPAATPDGLVAVNSGSQVTGPTLARDASGNVWVAWFTQSGKSDQGYWVDKILPSKVAKVKAPNSGAVGANNQPFQPVAFTPRKGGGLFFAYCAPSTTVLCAHVNLWKVGQASAVAVPGSATGRAANVAIAAAPGGHLWIMWYDAGLNKLKLVRTNAAVTKFGTVQTLPVPSGVIQFDGLQAEGSQGPLDLVVLILQDLAGSTPAYWATQVLPKLGLTGSPSQVSHTVSTTITFKVTDVGDPVPGATVKFLSKTATTNSLGIAKLTVPAGTSIGNHTATASKAGYTSATFTIKVT